MAASSTGLSQANSPEGRRSRTRSMAGRLTSGPAVECACIGSSQGFGANWRPGGLNTRPPLASGQELGGEPHLLPLLSPDDLDVDAHSRDVFARTAAALEVRARARTQVSQVVEADHRLARDAVALRAVGGPALEPLSAGGGDTDGFDATWVVAADLNRHARPLGTYYFLSRPITCQ